MGSNETATATTGGPRVIDVFDANEAPSGPNKTIFVRADPGTVRSTARSIGRPLQSLEDDRAGNTIMCQCAPGTKIKNSGARSKSNSNSHLRTATGLTLTLKPPNGFTLTLNPAPPFSTPTCTKLVRPIVELTNSQLN